MAYIDLCLKVIEEEKKKFKLDKNHLNLCMSKFSGDDAFYESPYFRCVFMYRYANVYVSFIQDSVKTFLLEYSKIEDLLKEWRSNSNLKFCSLSCGPALDYFGLILALTDNIKVDLQPFFKNIHIISKSAQWRNTYNFMIEAIELGYIKDFPVSMLCDDFKITQDPFKYFSSKQRIVIQDADVLFMMKLLRITNPDDDSVKENKIYFKDLVDTMKIGSILFCIDTKPTVDVLTGILQRIPGEYLYQPVSNNFKFSESFPDAFKDHYGSLPAFFCRGWFFIWKKISTSVHLPMENLNMKSISDATQINNLSEFSSVDSRNPNTIVSDSGIVGTNMSFISADQHSALFNNLSSVESSFVKYSQLNTAMQSRIPSGLLSSLNSDDKALWDVSEVIDLHNKYLKIKDKNRLKETVTDVTESLISCGTLEMYDNKNNFDGKNEIKLLLDDICDAVSIPFSSKKPCSTNYEIQSDRSSKGELLFFTNNVDFQEVHNGTTSSINVPLNCNINNNPNEFKIKQISMSISSNSSDTSKEIQFGKSPRKRKRGKKNKKLKEIHQTDPNANINFDNSSLCVKKTELISESNFEEYSLLTNKMQIISLESPDNNKVKVDTSKLKKESDVVKSNSFVNNSANSYKKIKAEKKKSQITPVVPQLDINVQNSNVQEEIEATSMTALTNKIQQLVKSFENVLVRQETSKLLPAKSNEVNNDIQNSMPFQFESGISQQVLETQPTHANHKEDCSKHVGQIDTLCSKSHLKRSPCLCQCSSNLSCAHQFLDKNACCSLGACSAHYVCNHCMPNFTCQNSYYYKSLNNQNNTGPCLVIPLANINQETLTKICAILQSNSKDN